MEVKLFFFSHHGQWDGTPSPPSVWVPIDFQFSVERLKRIYQTGNVYSRHLHTHCRRYSPCRPLALVQEGGGDDEGRTTGAKADFCLTAADTMLAGEKENTPEEEEQLEGSEVEEAMVGLDGTTGEEWKFTLDYQFATNALKFFQTRIRVGRVSLWSSLCYTSIEKRCRAHKWVVFLIF